VAFTISNLGGEPIVPWQQVEWLDDVSAWISARAELTGRPEPHSRHTKPWSVLFRAPTANGLLWFKEVCPALAFEPALTEALARRVPDCTPELFALEGRRMLIRDAGEPLTTLHDPASQGWLDVVARYAELQIELAPVAAELPAPDSRPDKLVSRFGERVRELVEVLGDVVPLSLAHLGMQHKHVHVRDGRLVFLDWADAAIAHPFCGLSETFHVLVNRHGAEAGGPEVLRARDAYLEPWTTFAPAGELRRIFAAGNVLGKLCQVAGWERKLATMPVAVQEQYAHKPEKWLRSFEGALHAPEKLGAWATDLA
jgi:hypothetical protein